MMTSSPVDVLVVGAGGFIGGHLVADLLAQGKSVRAVDVKPLDEWFQLHGDAQSHSADVSLLEAAGAVTEGAREVYMLAADMGGMGFIENNKALCMLSVLTSTHMLQAARRFDVERYFYSSSACVYAADKQTVTAVTALKETDAYPAMPEDGYGWEKLFSERMCRHFSEDFGLLTRVARYHNVYGPDGTWTGGREKAPAAVCRKVAEAVISGKHEVEIWGDGEQTRSFMYIDDCVRGSQMILASDVEEPLNLGSAELVSINQLYSVVEDIAGIKCTRRYDLSAPQGVRGRNADNTMIREKLGWEPSIKLTDGLAQTYAWIYDQVKRAGG
ncbi:NAD-dependent epimerase/dehydratase family protein [Nocardioides immobilis]|uniref:NAD-dependent epimerase/dehydratase family protein n=1 Tax=Nocardioides immobilis TaxID=2049295 RepID=A0A417Y8R3_9ACTN|nr:NAD-dependent epimerase/dehydratase family protein [Nocardioides immobilis]RHW29158.1 NAD-dependent epimerase/dehydratase family protein [Nocardioides immobilis]